MTAELLPVPHPTVMDRAGGKWYRWQDTPVPPSTADLYSQHKRLTDAELAAEFQAADAACAIYWLTDRDKHTKAWLEMKTFHRFATLPHYDEDQP